MIISHEDRVCDMIEFGDLLLDIKNNEKIYIVVDVKNTGIWTMITMIDVAMNELFTSYGAFVDLNFDIIKMRF